MKKPRTFRNVLIVRTDRVGDVVLTTPAIKALRQAYPAARISILVTPSTFDLVNGNPYLDEILTDDRRGRNKGLFGFFRLVQQLRARRFDLAIIFHTKRRYNLACSLSAIEHRLGYRNNKFGFLLTNPLKDPRAMGRKHEAEYCMDVLKSIGIKSHDLDVFVPLQKEAETWVRAWMEENHLVGGEFVAIHPGSSDPAKCWPSANFARLIADIAQRYPLKIVLVGSAEVAAVAAEILKLAPAGVNIVNMSGKTSLGQLASLLKRARLLISNDSGPVHVCAGVGTSVISLFLRDQPGINPGRWKPLGAKGHILCADGSGAIKVDDVLESVEQILKKDSQYEIF
jgi:heptosyltransferase-2